ncbi:hypothetical protein [Ferrimonas balearica]|uniref:hypothetical protein n=1 Tax=Ferrimonas balearica TaxID=44012 RepID=UPI001F1F2DBB|nr:hypothetical protein [Ferrimonas balearica]MBY6093810.1 hypothetical protein [Ferrimonas balearica]
MDNKMIKPLVAMNDPISIKQPPLSTEATRFFNSLSHNWKKIVLVRRELAIRSLSHFSLILNELWANRLYVEVDGDYVRINPRQPAVKRCAHAECDNVATDQPITNFKPRNYTIKDVRLNDPYRDCYCEKCRVKVDAENTKKRRDKERERKAQYRAAQKERKCA